MCFQADRPKHTQILELNPDFNPSDFNSSHSGELERRYRKKSGRYDIGNPRCGTDLNSSGEVPYASILHIKKIIDFLNDLPGDCNIEAHAATRMGCNNGAAVWVDTRGVFPLRDFNIPCRQLADMTSRIVKNCARPLSVQLGSLKDNLAVQGRVNDTSGRFDVVIAGIAPYDCTVALDWLPSFDDISDPIIVDDSYHSKHSHH